MFTIFVNSTSITRSNFVLEYVYRCKIDHSDGLRPMGMPYFIQFPKQGDKYTRLRIPYRSCGERKRPMERFCYEIITKFISERLICPLRMIIKLNNERKNDRFLMVICSFMLRFQDEDCVIYNLFVTCG